MKKNTFEQWDEARAINELLVAVRQLKYNCQAIYHRSHNVPDVGAACLGLNALADTFIENADHLSGLTIIVARQHDLFELTDAAYGYIE